MGGISDSRISTNFNLHALDKARSYLAREHREFIHSLGLRGMLYFPDNTSFKRKFARNLYEQIDPDRGVMKDNIGTEASLSTQMVHNLKALPMGGKPIKQDEGSVQLEAEEAVQMIVFKAGDAQKLVVPNITARLEDLHDAWIGGARCERNVRAMCYCYMLLAVAHVLAPSKTADHICKDVFIALQDPEAVSEYNWSGFILREILNAASSLRDTRPNEPVRLMGGLIVYR